MALVKKAKIKQLGFSPEASKVDNLTKALRQRRGVHIFKSFEMVSVFDLVSLSVQAFNEDRKKYSPCHIKNWHMLLEKAKKDKTLRLQKTVNHVLTTDDGEVQIDKDSQYETFFIVLEDFQVLLTQVQEEQPTVGKRLSKGWDRVIGNRYATHRLVDANF